MMMIKMSVCIKVSVREMRGGHKLANLVCTLFIFLIRFLFC